MGRHFRERATAMLKCSRVEMSVTTRRIKISLLMKPWWSTRVLARCKLRISKTSCTNFKIKLMVIKLLNSRLELNNTRMSISTLVSRNRRILARLIELPTSKLNNSSWVRAANSIIWQRVVHRTQIKIRIELDLAVRQDTKTIQKVASADGTNERALTTIKY